MAWLREALRSVKEKTTDVAGAAFSVWTDKIVSYIDLKTKYGYGKVSFQKREDHKNGGHYLIIEHRSPEGHIWIPLTEENIPEIQEFLSKNFPQR